jgi:hypothetical protein
MAFESISNEAKAVMLRNTSSVPEISQTALATQAAHTSHNKESIGSAVISLAPLTCTTRAFPPAPLTHQHYDGQARAHTTDLVAGRSQLMQQRQVLEWPECACASCHNRTSM